MSGSIRCKEPIASTPAERLTFAHLVRQGFPEAQDLERRIHAARWLAFHYEADDTLAGVAALKAPSAQHRNEIFAKADAMAKAADHDIELGWIYVAPAYRGNRIGERLCRTLMRLVPTTSVYAITRPDNAPMIRILLLLGFTRVGRPYRRRDEELALFLRSVAPS